MKSRDDTTTLQRLPKAITWCVSSFSVGLNAHERLSLQSPMMKDVGKSRGCWLCAPLLLTVCWQPNPVRIVWPEKTHQWGNLLIFFLPMFPLPELFVSFCSLPLFYLQAEGSIETLLHLLVPIFKEARLSFLSTQMHLHHFSSGTI